MQKIVRDGIQNEKQIRRIAKIYIAISWTLTVALMVTIFCLSSQVSSKSSGLSSGVISRITELFHITLTQHTVRKTAHALEYAALCFLFSCSWQSVFLKSQHTLSFCPRHFMLRRTSFTNILCPAERASRETYLWIVSVRHSDFWRFL